MPTKKQVETTELRAAVVERHGDRCVICNKGPLQRSGLHLHYDSRAHLEHLPMCKECCAAAKGKNWVGEGDNKPARKKTEKKPRTVRNNPKSHPNQPSLLLGSGS